MSEPAAAATKERSGDQPSPRDGLLSTLRFAKFDVLSGFLVFLIAMPLCLGIAEACNFPPITGIFTAIVGSIIATLISNSELTIKGPAAGLIVIVLGCVLEFGHTGGKDPIADTKAYQMALGVGVAAGLIQIAFGLLRAGVLGEFFPTAAVHGMLASIGLIIISKQTHVALGVKPEAQEPLRLYAEIPHSIMNLNPHIAIIGIVSLIIMFGMPFLKIKALKKIPSQMIVVLVAIGLGIYFNLQETHPYQFIQRTYEEGPKFLVSVPSNIFAVIQSTRPDFSGLQSLVGWKWVMLYALIGSLESMLSAKAIDLIDPWRRKTNMNRDLLAIGVGNTASAFVGGLPMISEIVRSKANIDNGARSRWSDFYHGCFLLAFCALLPGVIHMIPKAALAAMLIFTGFRLASPREFAHTWKVGPEQLIVFISTIIGVLAIDLLVGILIGIAVEFLIHLWNGAPFGSMFKPSVDVAEQNGSVVISVKHSAVFSSWIGLKGHIERQSHNNGTVKKEVVIDLAGTRLVDHTVMEKLHEMQKEFKERDCVLVIKGLDDHRGLSAHPMSARKRPK